MADILMANLDPRRCRPEAPSIQRWGAALFDQVDWHSGSLGTHERLEYWDQIDASVQFIRRRARKQAVDSIPPPSLGSAVWV